MSSTVRNMIAYRFSSWITIWFMGTCRLLHIVGAYWRGRVAKIFVKILLFSETAVNNYGVVSIGIVYCQ